MVLALFSGLFHLILSQYSQADTLLYPCQVRKQLGEAKNPHKVAQPGGWEQVPLQYLLVSLDAILRDLHHEPDPVISSGVNTNFHTCH